MQIILLSITFLIKTIVMFYLVEAILNLDYLQETFFSSSFYQIR